MIFADKDIAECVRGRNNPRKGRTLLKLLKLRLENRMRLKAVGAKSNGAFLSRRPL